MIHDIILCLQSRQILVHISYFKGGINKSIKYGGNANQHLGTNMQPMQTKHAAKLAMSGEARAAGTGPMPGGQAEPLPAGWRTKIICQRHILVSLVFQTSKPGQSIIPIENHIHCFFKIDQW